MIVATRVNSDAIKSRNDKHERLLPMSFLVPQHYAIRFRYIFNRLVTHVRFQPRIFFNKLLILRNKALIFRNNVRLAWWFFLHIDDVRVVSRSNDSSESALGLTDN